MLFAMLKVVDLNRCLTYSRVLLADFIVPGAISLR